MWSPIQLLALAGFCSSLTAAPLSVDLSAVTDRRDSGTPGWEEWQVATHPSASCHFDCAAVTLRVFGSDASLEGAWLKAGLATGASLATDGVRLPAPGAEEGIEIELWGLPPGPHSFATFHNTVWGEEAGPYRVWIVGRESEAVIVTPTRQVESDASIATAYLPFTLSQWEPVRIRLARTEDSVAGPLILNGFEIDQVDPAKKALAPQPESGDWHADGNTGQVRLSWKAARTAKRHRVYFFPEDDLSLAIAAAESADQASAGFVGEVKGNTCEVPITPHDSLQSYAWRVDSVDADGHITRGDVWTFRVRHLAFPGAGGYGRFAIGGRGGRVLKVTNLNDSGPGSLRAAIEAEGPRTIVFDVSGRIVLKSPLVVRNPFVTIAGQTAPGKGICLSNYNFGVLGGRDVIIRYLRVRPGDTAGKTLDGMGLASSDHCIIDHCSISWTQDEAFSSRAAGNITLQRTLISEALNIAGHRSYEEGKQHGYAASIGGDIGSFHHNLLAHNAGRNWSLAGGLDKATRHTGRLDIRNNVVYNWGHRTTDGGAKEVNFVNNYYKPGPASEVFHVLMPERKLVGGFGPQDYFVEGNVMEGHYGPEDPTAGIRLVDGAQLEDFLVEEPFFPGHVEPRTAAEAYDSVLADVGVNVPTLDDHDRRILREVREGTVTYAGSRSGLPGLPDSQEDVGGWEEYPEVHRPKGWDSDDDGMPDGWESAHGLDPKSAEDGPMDSDGDGFTNLEEYLNSLAARSRA